MNVWLLQEQQVQQASLEIDDQHARLMFDGKSIPIQVFISTVTGGTFREYLTSITHAALLIDPCCRRFILPCRSGIGAPCENCMDLEWQFSPELCCEYACDGKNIILLRDTRKTILKKVELAQETGIATILISDASHQMITASSK